MARYYEVVREEMRGKPLDREAVLAKVFVASASVGTVLWLAVIATVGIV